MLRGRLRKGKGERLRESERVGERKGRRETDRQTETETDIQGETNRETEKLFRSALSMKLSRSQNEIRTATATGDGPDVVSVRQL